MSIAAALEAVFLIYVTLSGTELALVLLLRAVVAVLYTGLLAVLLMVPARLFLRMYSGRIHRAMTEEKAE